MSKRKITIRVEQRHIDEARHEEVENGRQVGRDPISRAVLETVQAAGIEHDRAWVYRGKPISGLWLCVRHGEDVKLSTECDLFIRDFDARVDGKPKPFSFEVAL